jgi:hypothetical protein
LEAAPDTQIETFALGIPTILGGLYWTEKAYNDMYYSALSKADRIKYNSLNTSLLGM